MTKPEKKFNEPDKRVTSLVTSLETKFEMFMQEMRDRDNQRAEDIREIRSGLDSMGKHVRNLSVAAMVGVGTSVIAVVVMVGTMFYTILTH